MIRYLLSRVGCLMLIVGSIILVVGIAAERSGQPAFSILLGGGAVTFIGFMLWNKLRKKTSRSPKFSLFRKRNRREERKQDDGWDNPWEDRFYD